MIINITKWRDFTVYFINIRIDGRLGRWREDENQGDQSQDAPYLMDTQTDLLIIRKQWITFFTWKCMTKFQIVLTDDKNNL